MLKPLNVPFGHIVQPGPVTRRMYPAGQYSHTVFALLACFHVVQGVQADAPAAEMDSPVQFEHAPTEVDFALNVPAAHMLHV